MRSHTSHSATGTMTKAGGCGCGCGGGGSSSAGPCSCKKEGCSECETHGLVRPHFFAGQLLTEDDLGALTNYVVGKQRLHARHLHGAGVVCGLEVSCAPCGGGTVTVKPGYALDCCGNDIVVPCASTLDILAMIRQLSLDKHGGHDCGDPCAESKAARRKPKTSTPVPEPKTNLSSGRGEIMVSPTYPGRPELEEDEEKPFRRRYCLYVKYCETPADPVKPFVIDEPCGDGSACEFTRVREGYRFELRCEHEEKPPLSMGDRIQACLNVDELQDYAWTKESSALRFDYQEYASAAIAADTPLRAEANEMRDLRPRLATLEKFSKEFAITGAGADPEPPEERYREALDTYGAAARFAAKVGAIDQPDAEAVKLADEARKRMVEAEPIMRRRLEVFRRTEDLLTARAILDEGTRWADVAGTLTPQMRRSEEARFFIFGSPSTPELQTYDRTNLTRLYQWLRRRIGGGVASDCLLASDLELVRITPEMTREEVREARRILMEVFERYVRACVCAAILPPCPPCDDTAVLLACLTVEECEVVEICNLERTFVLTWPTFRYWLPTFSEMGKKVEEFCCEPQPKKKASRISRVQIPSTATPELAVPFEKRGLMFHTYELQSSTARLTPLESALRVIAPAGDSTAARLTRILDQAITPAGGGVPAEFERIAVPQGQPLADALKSPEPTRLIKELVNERINELRPATALADVADEMNAKVAGIEERIKTLNSELKLRPLASALGTARPIRSATDRVAELEKFNKNLENTIGGLRKRIEELEKK